MKYYLYPCVFGCFQSVGKLQFQHLIFLLLFIVIRCYVSTHFSPLKKKSDLPTLLFQEPLWTNKHFFFASWPALLSINYRFHLKYWWIFSKSLQDRDLNNAYCWRIISNSLSMYFKVDNGIKFTSRFSFVKFWKCICHVRMRIFKSEWNSKRKYTSTTWFRGKIYGTILSPSEVLIMKF